MFHEIIVIIVILIATDKHAMAIFLKHHWSPKVKTKAVED